MLVDDFLPVYDVSDAVARDDAHRTGAGGWVLYAPWRGQSYGVDLVRLDG